jgi:hypothetical protein
MALGNPTAGRIRGVLAVFAIAGMVAAACSKGPDDGEPTGAPVALAGAHAPRPIESALEVEGTAVLDPSVRIIEVSQVSAIDASGTTLVADAGAAADLAVGTLFVVPGVASGRVLGLTPTDGGVQVAFEQPDIVDLFAELDVRFSGRPDPELVMWETDPVTASADGDAFEVFVPVALDDLPEVDESASAETSGLPPLASTEAASTVRVVTAVDPAAEGGDEGPSGCAPARGDEDGAGTAIAAPGAQSFTATVADYTVEVRHRLDGLCGTHYFKINTTRDDSLSITTSLFGWITSDRVDGELIITGDSLRQTVDLQVSGEMWFSMSGQVRRQGVDPSGVKVSFNAVKRDIPVVLGGVPFIVRLGAPFSFEARLPSLGDTLTATLLHLSCDGRFGTDGEGSGESTCTAAPVVPHIAESFGPMSFIVAAGMKVGFGPGVVIPMGGTEKNTLFAGATATLSTSTGLTRSGTAGAPLVDCIRVDRSVQFNVAAEAQVFGLSMSSPLNIWRKSGTDNLGRQCPTSGM